jgi:hypothetical protein
VTVCNYCTRVLYATIDTVDVHTLARNEGFNWQVSIALAVDSEVFLQQWNPSKCELEGPRLQQGLGLSKSRSER